MTQIFLAGGTGLVGSHALARLLSDERVTRVIAPTRKPLPPHARLHNPQVDSDSLPRNADWWVADGAICALGTTRAKAGSAAAFRAIDHDYILAVADNLRRAGTPRFALTSSVGANARSLFLYTRTKGEVEEAVRRLAFPSLTIVRPGFLAGDRQKHRTMERLIGGLLTGLAPVIPASARVSPAATVAALLVEAALTGATGTHLVSPADIAHAAARGHG